MSTEEALAVVIQTQQQEIARLQADNARLREIIATYPERQTVIATTLADLRDQVYTLLSVRRPVQTMEAPLHESFPGLGATNGLAPPPDEAFWRPLDTGPTLREVPVMPPQEQTQAEIPEDVGWSDEGNER